MQDYLYTTIRISLLNYDLGYPNQIAKMLELLKNKLNRKIEKAVYDCNTVKKKRVQKRFRNFTAMSLTSVF